MRSASEQMKSSMASVSRMLVMMRSW